jgi:hypothetical protein
LRALKINKSLEKETLEQRENITTASHVTDTNMNTRFQNKLLWFLLETVT